ncbi:hypothetical protein [Phocaeicola coprophilus]|nr:hypothetical protein [Phocaeicola coprophilus]
MKKKKISFEKNGEMLGMLWKSCTFAASNREGMTKMRFWAMV